MQIYLNGAPHSVPDGTNLEQLLALLGISGRFAIEVNAVVIRRALHPEHTLQEGDRVEVVTFVGGGA